MSTKVRVHIDFVLDGLRGRETYEFPKSDWCTEYDWAAWQQFEENLIDEAGLKTFECGCCIDPEEERLESDFEFTEEEL